VNKIKGQADTKRPRRAKNAGATSRREDFGPKITPEMLEAGASVLDAAVSGCSSLEGISGRATQIAEQVFLAMGTASRRTIPMNLTKCRRSNQKADLSHQ